MTTQLSRASLRFFGLLFSLHICLAGQAQIEETEFYYPDGQLSSKGPMVDGRPDGYWITYYPNGQVKSEGGRSDFQLDSLWRFYTEQGEIKEEITYAEGKRNGLSRKYREGVLLEEASFVADVKEGWSRYYFEGLLHKEIPFENGRENGKGYEYDISGDIVAIMTYKDGFLRNSERLNRTDKIGRRQGIWKSFYDDKSVHTEAVFVDDLKNGLYKEYDEQGKLIVLEKYVNGVLDTEAAETMVLDIRNEYYPGGKVKVSGSYRDGEKHGVFREYDEDGNIVASTVYENGEAVSTGVINKSGTFEGEWVTYYDDGTTRAEGVYEAGLRVDKWSFYHLDGRLSQKGAYRKGKPHGEWRWYHQDGSLKREETYRRGLEDGESIEYDESGTVVAKGKYIDGLKDGPWMYRVGDHTIEAGYRDGERHGKWYGRYDNGKTQFKGEFSNGLPVGKHRFYFPTGMVRQEGKYNSGRRNGDWRLFDEDGELIITTKYRNGIETHLEGRKITPTYQELQID